MPATSTRTMTDAQMNWNLKRGFAWPEPCESNPLGLVSEWEWFQPLWTRDGCWTWDAGRQLYEMH